MGVDGIQAELFRTDIDTTTEIITGIINRLWNKGKMSKECTEKRG